jgi:hypothetical protein
MIIDYLLAKTKAADQAALNALDDEHQTPVCRDYFLYYLMYRSVFA